MICVSRELSKLRHGEKVKYKYYRVRNKSFFLKCLRIVYFISDPHPIWEFMEAFMFLFVSSKFLSWSLWNVILYFELNVSLRRELPEIFICKKLFSSWHLVGRSSFTCFYFRCLSDDLQNHSIVMLTIVFGPLRYVWFWAISSNFPQSLTMFKWSSAAWFIVSSSSSFNQLWINWSQGSSFVESIHQH